MPFCSKFIKKTVYQILLESPEFSRKYFKKHVGLFFGHTVYLLVIFVLYIVFFVHFWQFLPRCMQYRRGLAMRKLSVCPSVDPSVRLANAWIVTKRKKDLSRFLYHTKDHLA